MRTFYLFLALLSSASVAQSAPTVPEGIAGIQWLTPLATAKTAADATVVDSCQRSLLGGSYAAIKQRRERAGFRCEQLTFNAQFGSEPQVVRLLFSLDDKLVKAYAQPLGKVPPQKAALLCSKTMGMLSNTYGLGETTSFDNDVMRASHSSTTWKTPNTEIQLDCLSEQGAELTLTVSFKYRPWEADQLKKQELQDRVR